jgi:hypothetical protein
MARGGGPGRVGDALSSDAAPRVRSRDCGAGGRRPGDPVADRYRKLAGDFAGKVQNVAVGDWDRPTPCPDWSVRDLVGHVVAMHEVHLQQVHRRPRPGPGVDRDPLGSFVVVRDQVQEDLDDPERAAVTYPGRFGR